MITFRFCHILYPKGSIQSRKKSVENSKRVDLPHFLKNVLNVCKMV